MGISGGGHVPLVPLPLPYAPAGVYGQLDMLPVRAVPLRATRQNLSVDKDRNAPRQFLVGGPVARP